MAEHPWIDGGGSVRGISDEAVDNPSIAQVIEDYLYRIAPPPTGHPGWLNEARALAQRIVYRCDVRPRRRRVALPPVSHLRKMRRRMELLEEHEGVIESWREKEAGPRRAFVHQYDLVMRDCRRMIAEAIAAIEENPHEARDKIR